MRIYRINILGDKYPTDYNVEASGWGTAVARAIREWQRSSVGKGSRTDRLRIIAVKSTTLLQEKEEE